MLRGSVQVYILVLRKEVDIVIALLESHTLRDTMRHQS